ncbi:MAG: phage baseplate assembly protein V [Rhodocyclaceae bacterium]|nr:phage baseplate assembly protein V [Rhodocyclaceae bacterium]
MIETLREFMVTLKYGIVTALDATTQRVRVRLPDLDDLETHWLPVLSFRTRRDRITHLPDVGEHVAVLLDPQGENGLVLGALYSARDPAPADGPDITAVRFADGTAVEYDRAAHRLTIHCTGDIEIVSDTHLTLRAPRIDLNP